jgi:hypothetical protein
MNRIRIILLFLFLLAVFSCGIPGEIPVLSKPLKLTENDIDDYFEFKATEENGGSSEEDFRGFEVYYKFFAIDTETSILEYQSGFTSIEELQGNYFRRVTYYINDTECDKTTRIYKPLIKVPSGGTEAVITIDFEGHALNDVFIKSIPVGYISIPGGGSELPIRRGIEDNEDPGYYKSFQTYRNIYPVDSDISGIDNLDEISPSILIMIYVLSYGIFDLSQPLYSDALCLGWIELDDITIEEE